VEDFGRHLCAHISIEEEGGEGEEGYQCACES
jgi:hypothetical protein